MVDLTCPMTTETFKLDVHIQGNEFLDFKNFVKGYKPLPAFCQSGIIIILLTTAPFQGDICIEVHLWCELGRKNRS